MGGAVGVLRVGRVAGLVKQRGALYGRVEGTHERGKEGSGIASKVLRWRRSPSNVYATYSCMFTNHTWFYNVPTSP